MTLFTLRSLKKDFGIKEILKDANFSLEEGDKVGLIGCNGSGKSTLLKMIAGLESIDSGELWVNSGAKIVYLPQQPEMDDNHTVLEQVFAESNEKMTLVREYEEVSEKLTHSQGDADKLIERLSTLSEKMDVLGAWELENNAKIILGKLGIEDLEAKVGSLSGGYRKRIAIAAALSPLMQKGNEIARYSHIVLNIILVGLFGWQAVTGMDIVQRIISKL
jgi:ATP-binding cassette subfamily F protein uup